MRENNGEVSPNKADGWMSIQIAPTKRYDKWPSSAQGAKKGGHGSVMGVQHMRSEIVYLASEPPPLSEYDQRRGSRS